MLYLTKRQLDKLVSHAKKDFPNEVCGIVAGGEGKIKKIYEMTNIEVSRKTFFMDPKEQLTVLKDIRNLGLDFIGIYHSHPETDAYPSVHDIELAYYPEVSYIIMSLKDKDNPEIRSFRIIEGKVEEEEIEFER